VRQVLDRHVEPIPPFAATVMGEAGEAVGVVRVHESADTPHITKPDGAIYVRSVAADRRYHSLPLESQATLFALAERGERAALEAKKLFAATRTPLMEAALRLEHIGGGSLFIRGAAALLRAVPLTHHRMTEWAVTEEAREALFQVVTRLARVPRSANPSSGP